MAASAKEELEGTFELLSGLEGYVTSLREGINSTSEQIKK